MASAGRGGIMKVYQYEEFPEMLIKFSNEKKHLQDLANGNVFMMESGYFRKLDDRFRGDKFAGKCVIDMNSPEWCIRSGPTESNPEVITLPGTSIKDFSIGFKGDNKIPMFCCTELSESILEEPVNHTMHFKSTFIEEMEQFGQYYMIFSRNEFINNMYEYIQKHEFGGRWGNVTYTELSKAYDHTSFGRGRNIYDPFFIKDISYKKQNEWRIILKPSCTPIIKENENHHIATIPPLKWCHIGETKEMHFFALTAIPKND